MTSRAMLWQASAWRALALIVPALLLMDVAAGEGLVLNEGDHICLVGNTLAERMQHDGYLETLLQRRFAGKNVSVRNLAFNADEVTIRQRSEGFGSPEEWLDKVDASVVFAFFGFNESFAGEEGVAKFESDLANWVRATKGAKFDDKSNPRIVLFSPIAAEDLQLALEVDGAREDGRQRGPVREPVHAVPHAVEVVPVRRREEVEALSDGQPVE